MRDTHVTADTARSFDGGDPIASFAARVLDVLVDRNRRTSTVMRPDLVVALAEGMVTLDGGRLESTLAAFRRACISPAAMADAYIPAAAHHLGSGWSDDRMNFAQVSVGIARLQALVRAIGTRWGGDPVHLPDRRSALVIVPESEQHTLGAIVVSGQLRRMGMSVCLRLGPEQAEVVELLRTRTFDLAMVSVGSSARLDPARRLVETLRRFGPKGIPVLGGGAVLGQGEDLRAQTGVDFATQDIGAALAFCGCARRLPAGEKPLSLSLALPV